MDTNQPSSSRLGDEVATLHCNVSQNEISKAEPSSSRQDDEIPALQSNGSEHNEISEAEPFSSRHGDEIITLHSNESHNEISKAESSSSRHEDEIAILQSKTQNEILEAESSSSRHGDEVATLHINESRNELSEAESSSSRHGDEVATLHINESRNEISEAESSSSRHGDEIATLHNNENPNEISEAQESSSGRHGDEIATLHNNENPNEISEAQEKNQFSERKVDYARFLLVNRLIFGNKNDVRPVEDRLGQVKWARTVTTVRIHLTCPIHVERDVYHCSCENNNDWKGLEDYITETVPEDLMACLTTSLNTIFHRIAISDAPTWLLEKLLSRVPPESLLQMTDKDGCTPLFYAANHGNTKFVEIFLSKNNDLLNTRNNSNSLPIHEAADLGQRETVNYLLSVNTLPLDGADGVTLIKSLIGSNLFDIALDLLKKYPKIAGVLCEDTESILELLAKRPKAFASGTRFGIWKRLLYQWIPLREEYNPHPQNVYRDPESQIIATPKIMFTKFLLKPIVITNCDLCQKLKNMIWNTLVKLGGPSIKDIRDTKLIHMKTLEIVRIMCMRAQDTWSTGEEAEKSLRKPMFTAARCGITEIVNEIINNYIFSINFEDEDEDEDKDKDEDEHEDEDKDKDEHEHEDEDEHNILDIAVRHRQEKVFNVIYRQCQKWLGGVANLELKGINTLHLAGMLVPSSEVPGAALQMQRELQWFKAVENYCHPSYQDQLNLDKKTPRELFTEQHQGLVEKGERWMKDTAQSCSVVAALIITVAFAAVFTVPGGSDDSGTPNQLYELSFIIFGISDALALFSSTASVLMFLGILTSRFSEDDFLKSLPKKLIIGLITLFFSIASLMVAFAATAYIVLFHQWKWAIIPMALLVLVPVTLFTKIQFPLLLDMYSSTYGSGFLQQASKNVILNSSDKKFK